MHARTYARTGTGTDERAHECARAHPPSDLLGARNTVGDLVCGVAQRQRGRVPQTKHRTAPAVLIASQRPTVSDGPSLAAQLLVEL